jgi:RecB family exonuclease
MMSIDQVRPALGTKFQPAPGVLVLTASRLREFDTCRRRYFLASVLRLRTEGNSDATLDPSGELPMGRVEFGNVSAATVGSYVHEELHARHANPALHQQATPVRDDQPPLAVVDRAVQRHLELCPGQDGATYLGGELDLRWFIPGKLVLVNGRVDALWQHDDGILEVRDYKTGSALHELDNDIGALMYALLAAANHPGRPIRVSYEYLGNEPEAVADRLVSLDVTKQHLLLARHRLDSAVEQIRKEQQFLPTPDVHTCKWCPYASNCDAALKENLS